MISLKLAGGLALGYSLSKMHQTQFSQKSHKEDFLKSGQKYSQNFYFYLQILKNALLNGFECRESPVHRSCTFWIVRYVSRAVPST